MSSISALIWSQAAVTNKNLYVQCALVLDRNIGDMYSKTHHAKSALDFRNTGHKFSSNGCAIPQGQKQKHDLGFQGRQENKNPQDNKMNC